MEKVDPLTTPYKFYCKACRTLLFTQEALVEHKTGPKKVKKGEPIKKIPDCTSYFTNQRSWMKLKEGSNTGKLFCPNDKVLPLLNS